MKKFVITTAIGGMLFLIPLVFLVLILGKAFKIMTMVAEPLGRFLPVDSIAGVGLIDLLALVAMLLFCFLAGLIARSPMAQRFYQRIDNVLLELIPGYAWSKTVMKNLGGEAETDRFKPVLVTLDDQLQLAFEMERSADNLVVVFLPGAPDVRSGSVAYVTADRVKPLDTSFLSMNKTLKHMGKGAAALLPPGHQQSGGV